MLKMNHFRRNVLVVIPALKVFQGTHVSLLPPTYQVSAGFCPVAGGCFNFTFDNASLDIKPHLSTLKV